MLNSNRSDCLCRLRLGVTRLAHHEPKCINIVVIIIIILFNICFC